MVITVEGVFDKANSTISNVLRSRDLVNDTMKITNQVMDTNLYIETTINNTEDNIHSITGTIEEVNETGRYIYSPIVRLVVYYCITLCVIGVNLTTLNRTVVSLSNNLSSDIDDLTKKSENMISEIDAIIQSLSGIHQEINQVKFIYYALSFQWIIALHCL